MDNKLIGNYLKDGGEHNVLHEYEWINVHAISGIYREESTNA